MNTQTSRLKKQKISVINRLTWVLSTVCILLWNGHSVAKNVPLSYEVNYLKLLNAPVATFSNINVLPENSGLPGAQLAVADANSTGKFIGQSFTLSQFELHAPQEVLKRIDQQFKKGVFVFLVSADSGVFETIDKWAKNKPVLVFNVSEPADDMRHTLCLSSVLHTVPSYRMKSDALAQWLVAKRLSKILLIKGKGVADEHIAYAFSLAAKRFGLNIIEQKVWDFNTDLRRSTQQEIPLFTQTSRPYDVVFVADAHKDFAEFIPYNTYLPRPVIGSAGLEALAWHRVIEQWGAAQLQSRFRKMAARDMNELDFSAYLAVRSVAQAAQQTGSGKPAELIDYIHSDDFELAAYKGRKLSFRSWNGQLRMPLALVQPNAFVSESPQAGMLHPTNELDTLGFDAREMRCE
ncbi:amino acid/amide ABC transporter substrate-binding protein, HAAT family [Paraglaciecola sp. T6c]|uniref:ABC transporter substrate-binding protein n=1 Tax=Pseudoalteromonas atlantica (strain T6c / ATCC BAA-1087) TaxID=3042615 RepID=UPI00005C726E|nr:ABC transporter substrate-binding protein [Paraglaciecola sp. T6c]ABG40378.1 amino acid/amide ABC transporter substrate-binding protein, HAAT family [Paraglaciecola sp. T6c]